MNRQLWDLEALAAMVFDAELARLKAISAERAARQADLADLAAARAARSRVLESDNAAEDLALLTGQDVRWARWRVETGARLSRELAEIAARREDQRLRTQKAFGKRDALRQMRARAEAERHRSNARTRDL